MNRNSKLVLFILCNLFFLLGFSTLLKIQAQIAIAKPTLGFTQICASPSFNTFDVTFSFSPTSGINTSNQFIVEMSDGNGSFTTPTELHRSVAGAITSSPAKITFSVPLTTSGENYRIRVRSTSPASVSQLSNPFPAYYKPQDSQYTINNSVQNVTICSGGTYLLSIDNPGTGQNDSPLKYPGLTFNWFKDNGNTVPPTKVAAAIGGSYMVTAPGTYYVETNYGSCTSSSYSNKVTVTTSSTGALASITSSQGNPYCAAQGSTLLTVTQANSYQWFKDNVAISNATSQTYTATSPGVYSAKISFGSCEATATIDLKEVTFSSTLNVPPTQAIDFGTTVDVQVTTTASTPTFQWYLNEVLIPNVTTNNYVVTSKGKYKVVITQPGSCTVKKEVTFEITYVDDPDNFPDVANIPNVISPNGDFINDTWVLPKQYVKGTNTEVIIINAAGEIVLQTKDYENNWPLLTNPIVFKNVNPIYFYIITTADNKVKKGSITVLE